MPIRKERNRRLRELAERKNLAFRKQFLGETLSVVTLGQGRMALSSNYLKVELLREATDNVLRDVRKQAADRYSRIAVLLELER